MDLKIPPFEFPKMGKVRQRLPRPRVDDIPGEVRRQLASLDLKSRLRPGDRIAITAGSRGITNIAPILAVVAEGVREAGGEPFLVSAMGSHGGGTPEGQKEVLDGLGITEAAVGAPIRVTSETVVLGRTASGHTVYCDAVAAEADGILAVNRIKPHTSFRGKIESGLMKILTVGLGKHPGASSVHALGAGGIEPAIREMARFLMTKRKVVGGLGILENGYEETAGLAAIPTEEIEETEKRLLIEARDLMPRLPVDDIDVLIVDEMGKNYSGTGMDSNIIGRIGIQGVPDPETPRVTSLVVLRLSEESHGNANGVGLADFTTRRLVDRIDYQATYLNCLTANFPRKAAVPIALEDDRQAIAVALYSARATDPARARVVRIPNTLHLEEISVSGALLPVVMDGGRAESIQLPAPMQFDQNGNLI